MVEVGNRIPWSPTSCWGSHLRPWRKVPSPGRRTVQLLTRHRVHDHGAAAGARRLEEQERENHLHHHDRTGSPPPPSHHRRGLGFGLERPPPHPRPVSCSSSALRRAWTSRRTTLGETRRPRRAGEEGASRDGDEEEPRRDGEEGEPEGPERGRDFGGGSGAREGDLAGQWSAGGVEPREIRQRRWLATRAIQRGCAPSLGARGTGRPRR
jgi:hypothetical protein